MTTGKPPQPGLDAFHRERSKCIDAFAALEESLIRLQVALKQPVNGASFGQKLDALQSAKAGPHFAKARLAAMNALLPRCVALNDLRNDIVHARLQLATIGDEQRACFANTRYCMASSQSARLFALDGLRTVRTEAAALAELLNAV